MTILRWNPKRDFNEADIVSALNRCGRHCLRLDAFDLLVLNPNRTVVMLEIKTKAGKLTVLQQAMIAQGWPLKVVRTPDEALRAVGAIK